MAETKKKSIFADNWFLTAGVIITAVMVGTILVGQFWTPCDPELMDAVRDIFALRERLLPYLQSEYERKRKRFEPLIWPVFLTEPDCDCESDCFFCGDEILACPVFDRGATSVTLTLPKTARAWRLRGEGEPIAPGARLTVPCLPTDEPVWFKKL